MMKTVTRKILLLALTVLLSVVSGVVKAQWNTNTAVNILISGLPTADLQTANTSDGKQWIAFYHENAGNYDMRAQLIDADGNKLLGPDGVLVSNKPTGSATFVFNACVDGSNNFIIGCQDQRTGEMQAVLYKISQTGAHLWNPDGIILGGGLAPYPTALSNGEVACVWNESTSNSLKLHKITTTGTLAWASPVTILVGTSTTTRGQIAANLNGKFTIVYQKSAGGISTTLYAQQFTNAGTAVYAPLQICDQTTAGYRYYNIESDADTTYFGYYSSTGFRFNSFVQRINPNGTIPYGMNGASFNTSTSGSDSYQNETCIKLTPGSPYIWAVCTFCDPNQTIYGVYIQKFLKTSGARQFTNQGKIVYPISSGRDIQAGDLCLVDDTPMFMSYDANYKIYATRLDANGNFAWTPNRAEISSTTSGAGNPKGRYGFVAVNAVRCAGIWTEDRGTGDYGYAQGISVGGLIGLDVTTQGNVPAIINVGGGTLQMAAAIFPATASQNVNWSIIPGTGSAIISTTGLVTAIADGTVWAKAVAVQDNSMKDSMLITLSNQIPVLADVVTLPASGIDLSIGTLNGTVNANHFSSAVHFEWGLTAAYGNTIASTPAQVTGNTVTPVLTNLTSLASGTTYHYRCVATNSAGTANGQDLTFTTHCYLAGTIGLISGSDSVCAGSTDNIYSIAAYPGATSYVWTVPVGATITAGNTTNSITVSFAAGAQSGVFSVYATDGTCFSLTTQAFHVTVSSLPLQAGAINGNQLVCAGEQGITYSLSPMVGVINYIWSVPAGASIASGQNSTSIVVNYSLSAVSGNISVYCTNDCGGGTPSTLAVDVAPLPAVPGAITGPALICAEANNVVYSVAPVTNAYGYVWTVPQGSAIVSGQNTNQVTLHFAANATSGNISVYGTNGNCAGQPSSPLFIAVNPIPATPVITQHIDTLISSAASGNQWYFNGVAIPGATAQKHLAVYAGNYTVVVTLNGCSSAISNSLLVLPVSIADNVFGASFEIYPNPNNGTFDVKADSKRRTECTLEICNTLGAIIWKQENVVIDGAFTSHINLKQVQAGTYMLLVRSSDKTVYKKVIVTR
jgi:hypothetical protein